MIQLANCLTSQTSSLNLKLPRCQKRNHANQFSSNSTFIGNEQSQNNLILNISSDIDTDYMKSQYDFCQRYKELSTLSVYIKNPVTPLKSNPIKTWEGLKRSMSWTLSPVPARRYIIVVPVVPTER